MNCLRVSYFCVDRQENRQGRQERQDYQRNLTRILAFLAAWRLVISRSRRKPGSDVDLVERRKLRCLTLLRRDDYAQSNSLITLNRPNRRNSLNGSEESAAVCS